MGEYRIIFDVNASMTYAAVVEADNQEEAEEIFWENPWDDIDLLDTYEEDITGITEIQEYHIPNDKSERPGWREIHKDNTL